MKTLNDFPHRVMSPLETQVLLTLCVGESQKKPIVKSIEQDPMFRLIEGRLKAAGANPSPATVAWLALLANGIPGRGVMLAFTYYRLFPSTPASLDTFVCKFYKGDGVPTDEAYAAFWDYQKSDGANKLDNPETWTASTPQVSA